MLYGFLTPKIHNPLMLKAFNGVGFPSNFIRDWWLRSLWAKFGDFVVSYSWALNKYSKWVNYYPGLFIDKTCVERQVLDNELLFDFDNKDYKENVIGAKLLIKRLESHGLKFYCFFSGNKGFHISVFFDKPLIKTKYSVLIKKAIEHDFSFKDVLKRYYIDLMDDLFCSDFIDTPLMSVGRHLIRTVGSINFKGGLFKTFVKEPDYTKPIELLFPFNNSSIMDIQTNDLPTFSKIVDSLIKSKQSISVKHDLSNQVSLSRFFTTKKMFRSVNLFDIKLIDGRKRFVTFLLVPFLVSQGCSVQETKSRVNQWLSSCGHSGRGIDIDYLFNYCKSKKSWVNYSLIKEFRSLGYIK